MHAQAVIAGLSEPVARRIVNVTRDLLDVVGVEPSIAGATALVDKHNPALLLLGPPANRDDYRLIEQVRQRDMRVIVAAENKDADVILHALRAGAAEFVVHSDDADLRRAIRSLTVTHTAMGRVVTVFPAKGGVGATAVAVNLAGLARDHVERVCLLDLATHLGDVPAFLDLECSYTIADVLANLQRLDRDLLDSSVTRHARGFHVLAHNGNAEAAEGVTPADIEKVVAFLRQHFDCVIIDGVRGFDELSLGALDASDQVILLMTQDVPSVRNADRCAAIFKKLGYGEEKVCLVINRFHKSSPLVPSAIEESTSLHVAATLANDFPALVGAINRGTLLAQVAPRSRLTRDLRRLLQRVLPMAPAKPKRGFLHFFDKKVVSHGAR